MAIGKGAINDAKLAIAQANHDLAELNTKRVKNNNKYRQNMYADSQYHTKEFYNTFKKKGYNPITDVNIRNTKKKEKYDKDKKIY